MFQLFHLLPAFVCGSFWSVFIKGVGLLLHDDVPLNNGGVAWINAEHRG